MGTALTGLQVGSTYNGLLKTTDNAVINGTLRVITDGLGNDSALSISTAGVKSGGTLEVTGVATLTAQPILSSLTASAAVATDASKGLVSVTNTGTGNNVLATSPTLVTPLLGTPTSGTLTNCTGLPVASGISGLGTGIATALAVNTGSAGAPVLVNGALGTPSSGTVTNLTGTASININGTVGATTPNTVAATTGTFSGRVAANGALTAATALTVTANHSTEDQIRFTDSNGTPHSAWIVGIGAGDGLDQFGFYNVTAAARVASLSSTGLAVTGTATATGVILGGGETAGSSNAILASVFASSTTGLSLRSSDDVSGVSFTVYRRSNGTVIGSVGRVGTTDAVAYNTSSDARLKTNIRDFTDSGRLIDALRPRIYDWKSGSKDIIGFIAQEEHAADPMFAHIGAVTVGDDDPETITHQWQRSDSNLIPLLVAELKSLRARVAELEKK